MSVLRTFGTHWERVKADNNSTMKERLLRCNQMPDFEYYSILATNNNKFETTVMDSRLFNRGQPPFYLCLSLELLIT